MASPASDTELERCLARIQSSLEANFILKGPKNNVYAPLTSATEVSQLVLSMEDILASINEKVKMGRKTLEDGRQAFEKCRQMFEEGHKVIENEVKNMDTMMTLVKGLVCICSKSIVAKSYSELHTYYSLHGTIKNNFQRLTTQYLKAQISNEVEIVENEMDNQFEDVINCGDASVEGISPALLMESNDTLLRSICDSEQSGEVSCTSEEKDAIEGPLLKSNSRRNRKLKSLYSKSADGSFVCQTCNAVFSTYQRMYCHLRLCTLFCTKIVQVKSKEISTLNSEAISTKTGLFQRLQRISTCVKMKLIGGHLRPFYSSKRKTTFRCNVCKRHFSFLSVMKNHMRYCHPSRQSRQVLSNGVITPSSSNHNPILKIGEALNNSRERIPWSTYSQFMDGEDCCRLCHKKYLHRRYLIRHIRYTHLLERQHQCKLCNARYIRLSTLNDHVDVIHKNNYKYSCTVCNKKFGYKGTCNRHIATAHSSVKAFRCHICDARYKSKLSLRSHLAKVHNFDSNNLCGDM